MFVEIKVKRGRDNPVSVVTRVGKNKAVRKDCGPDDAVVKKVDAIIASGVFDLPTENQKSERAGKDLTQIKIMYRAAHSEKTVIRDYRWGEKFEFGFHEAEKLFGEIARMTRNAEP